ncbi:MAG: protein-disulfide reductase DsbD family protein [Caulobacter sp.]|nr:protein-disulfide reductase DsbD family protein [Caulobacter sp.]
MSRLLAVLLGLFALLGPIPAAAAPVDTGHLEAELVAQERGAVPGGTVYVALRQKIDKGWHTYWRNPGDSGEPTTITWTLPAGWQAGDIVWPTPARMPIGPLVNYGYSGEVLLPVPIQVPVTAEVGSTATLKADVTFLVCELTCIPEYATLTLAVPVVADAPGADPAWGGKVAATLAAAPRAAGLAAVYAVQDDTVRLAVTGGPLKGADLSRAYFFPFDATVLDHAGPQPIERGADGLTLSLPAGVAVSAGQTPAIIAGVLSLGDRAFEVSATAGTIPAGALGGGTLPPAPVEDHGPTAAIGAAIGLPLALVFAFLGGLILNLMPCVFPVLSMKAAALARHAHDTRAARMQGIAYLLGVLVTFLALAGVLIALKAAGQAIGWGFQLQSPAMVAALALVMLLVALNLSGVFEAGLSLQGAGGGATSRGGLTGSFLTGVLAVVVAAPCTAPFMASAMGFALTQDAWLSLPVFAALGLGLAAPFVLLSFAPGLLRRMPRPGPWMETLRHVLAFPMYAAVAWLVWVLAQQTGPMGLALALSAGVLAAFAAWLWGLAQRRPPAPVARGLAAVLAVAVIALTGLLAMESPATSTAAAEGAGEAAEVPSEPWSPDRVAALRAEGRPVFVNFTAAWCVTCQVNERTSLSTKAVADALTRNNAVYLKADWTRRDAVIAGALTEHGRAGVPLYLVYGADGSAPVILPQLLTEGMVAEALDKAAAR